MMRIGVFTGLALICLFAGNTSAQQVVRNGTSNAQLSAANGNSNRGGYQEPSEQDADRPVLQQRHPRYQIQHSDVLALSFPIAPELNQTVTVHPDGYVTLLSVGDLYVQGMTVPEATDALKKAYARILVNPLINVDLKDFQRPFFIVSGQVLKPGQFELRYDTTVSEALAVAGGANTLTGTSQVFLFHRVNSRWVEVKKLNLRDFLDGKNVNEDPRVQSGDMLYVPEKFISKFKKYVPYTTGIYLHPGASL